MAFHSWARSSYDRIIGNANETWNKNDLLQEEAT